MSNGTNCIYPSKQCLIVMIVWLIRRKYLYDVCRCVVQLSNNDNYRGDRLSRWFVYLFIEELGKTKVQLDHELNGKATQIFADQSKFLHSDTAIVEGDEWRWSRWASIVPATNTNRKQRKEKLGSERQSTLEISLLGYLYIYTLPLWLVSAFHAITKFNSKEEQDYKRNSLTQIYCYYCVINWTVSIKLDVLINWQFVIWTHSNHTHCSTNRNNWM